MNHKKEVRAKSFCERLRKKWPNRYYIYNENSYVSLTGDIEFYCYKHGTVTQSAVSHMRSGCYVCFRNQYEQISLGQFSEEATKIFGDKYNYSKVKFNDLFDEIIITCNEHGDFFSTPDYHLCGHHCPKCIDGLKYTKEEFVNIANIAHNYKFNYSLSDYVNAYTNIIIICPEHGEFLQLPFVHLQSIYSCKLCYYNSKRKS